MENQIICARCERPAMARYWMHIFRPNGTEEKVFCGKPPKDAIGQVVVFMDEKCLTVKKRDMLYRNSRGLHTESEVEDSGKMYRLSDLKIVRNGDRFLMVLPVSS